MPRWIPGFFHALFSASWLDYVAGVFGGLSVASLATFALSLDVGPFIEALLRIYDACIGYVIDPLGEAIVALVRVIAPNLALDLTMSETWRHGAVLIALYVQRHARNEWSDGKRATPAVQIVVGVALALTFALLGSIPRSGLAWRDDIFDIARFVLAVTSYDLIFVLWSAAFLRKNFSARAGNKEAEPPLRYIWNLGRRAAIRNATIFIVAIALYIALTLLGEPSAALPIAAVIFLVGVAWCSRGVNRALAAHSKPRDWKSIYKAYLSYPAGKLGNALILAFVVGAFLTFTGLVETRLGKLIELLA